MKVFVTGGTGFIGGALVRQLRERDDEVAVLARDPAKAGDLSALGCEIVRGDLGDERAIREGMRGADAVVHAAAIYEVGIPVSERPAMRDANVGGSERVLGAALEERVPKVVYISTVGIGQTRGQIIDEGWTAPGTDFTSCYEETKYEAHQVAERLIGKGLPCVIVQPGGVYGPGDHSSIGALLDEFLSGRMRMIPFPDLGICLAHVEDTAAGVVLALDRGTPGESYFLTGPVSTVREAIEIVAAETGREAPKRALPVGLMKALAPIGPLVGRAMGQPPNLRELISAADGVTFWATNEKARRELGFEPRPIAEGMRATLAAEGKLPSKAA